MRPDTRGTPLATRFQFTRRGLLRLGLVYALAGLCYAGMAEWGRRSDCAPHQVDGQCGMSTAFGRLYGLAGAGAIISLYHMRRRPRREAPRERGRRATDRRVAP